MEKGWVYVLCGPPEGPGDLSLGTRSLPKERVFTGSQPPHSGDGPVTALLRLLNGLLPSPDFGFPVLMIAGLGQDGVSKVWRAYLW